MRVYSKIFLFCFTLLNCSNYAWAEKENNYFQFAIAHYHTTRQSGQELNVYVRYAYKNNLPYEQYFDYRVAREDILKYLEPSEEFPKEVFWEILATQMGKQLMSKYPLKGVSVQLEVLDNPNKDSFEPGDHGPIYTIGEIEPLSANSCAK